MAATYESQRTVFRRIAQRPSVEWPVYDSTPLYERSSLAGLESDVRVVSEMWFEHESHDSVEQFVCSLPLTYFRFKAHDCYATSTRYEMDLLFRVFVLKELHRWNHETALVKYLTHRPDLREQLGLETVPDQSTLWRSWHKRFTPDLRETVETAAQTILINAQNVGVPVPCEPKQTVQTQGDDGKESPLAAQTVLEQAETITEHVSALSSPRSR